MVAKRHNPVIIAMARGLENKGLAPKAIVGASMRKLVHLIYGVVKSGRPFQAEIPMAELAIQEGIAGWPRVIAHLRPPGSLCNG